MTHPPDRDLLDDLRLLLHVDLVELDVGRDVRELLVHGRDLLARCTPLCPEVEEDEFVLLDL